jgi:hypothetical protein
MGNGENKMYLGPRVMMIGWQLNRRMCFVGYYYPSFLKRGIGFI